ncbi:MAG: hypothetical protein ABMB14_13825 [Myxococcota bacterium]
MPSFNAPYRCERCKTGFQAKIDVAAHRDAVAAREPPTLKCPKCGGAAHYEETREAFAAAAAKATRAASKATVVDEPKLHRHAQGDVTRLVLVGEMATSVRWRSAMDGADGELVVDLTQVTVVSGGGVSPLITALRAAAPGVRGVVVHGAPVSLAESLRGGPIPMLRIASLALDGHCPSCDAPRRATVEVANGAWEEALSKPAPCPVCGTTLVIGRAGDDVPHRSIPFGALLGLSSGLAGLGVLVVVVGLIFAGAGALFRRHDGMPETGGADHLELGAEQVVASGHGGPYGTRDEAEAAARDKALGTLVSAIAREISAARGISAGAVDVPPSEVQRFLEAVGTEPKALLVESNVTEGAGGVEVDAKYGLPRPKFDAIVKQFAEERDWGRIRVVQPFPPSGGLRVVKSAVDGLDEGTRIVRIGETAVSSLQDLPAAAPGLLLVIQDADGSERDLTLP